MWNLKKKSVEEKKDTIKYIILKFHKMGRGDQNKMAPGENLKNLLKMKL